MSKLKEIKQRCSMATPGPWSCGQFVQKFEIYDQHMSELYNGKSNRDFIASARTDLPWAVGWIERASIELRVLRAICRSMPKPRLGEWDWPGIEGRVDKLLSELTGDK